MIYTVAGALPVASGIILMPFYGELPPDVYGSLSIYFGFSLLVQILVTYSFDASIYLNFHEHKHDAKSLAVFVSSAFVFILLLSAAIGLVLALLGNFIFDRVYGVGQIPFLPFGVLSVATGIFQALFKVNNSLLQTEGKPTEYLWINLVSFSLIAVLTIAGLIVFPNTLWGPVGGKLLGTLISAIWILIGVFRKFGFHFNWKLLHPTFEFNNSSLIYQVQQWFINYYDRIIILTLVSKAAVGYYDIAIKFLLVVDFLLTGLNSTIYPKVLGKVHEQQNKSSTVEINRYYNGLTGVTILAVTGCILIIPPIITLFFNKPYHAAIPFIPFAALVYLLRPLRLWVAMPYAALKYSKPLPYFYLLVASVKIGLLYWLVQLIGVWGAIVSTLVSYMVEILILYLGIKDKFLFKMNTLKLVVAPLLVGTCILVVEPWLTDIYKWFFHLIYLILGILILLWAYRNELNVFKIKT
jgi:O-antigen/teichoic acid export membrane protein